MSDATTDLDHTGADDAQRGGLQKNAIGVFGICFFVIAAAAPIAGMTGLVPSIIVLGNGAAAPGTFLVAGLVFLVFSVGYAAMSNHVVHAGAFFAYIGRGFGLPWGVASAFLSVLSYCLVQSAVYGYFGAIMQATLPDAPLPWWAWSLLAVALVQVLGLLHAEFGAKLLGLLLITEVGSMLLAAGAVFVQGGGPEGVDLAASFSPGAIAAGAPGIAFAFAFAGFIGFEATAIYGEESRNPRRTVPRATYASVLIITGLFAVVTLGMVSGIGASKVVDETARITSVGDVPLADPTQLLFHVADSYVGSWLPTLMRILLLTSMFACVLAFHNSATRYFFAMGRSELLPRVFGRPTKTGIPANASFLQTAIATLIISTFAVLHLDPVVNLFYWFAIVAILALTIVQALVSLAVIVYFRRTRDDTRLWNTVIAPAASFVFMIVIIYLLMSRFGLISGTAGSSLESWQMSTTGWVLSLFPFVVFAIGLVFGYLRTDSRGADEALREFVG